MMFVVDERMESRELGYIIVGHTTVNGQGMTALLLDPARRVRIIGRSRCKGKKVSKRQCKEGCRG